MRKLLFAMAVIGAVVCSAMAGAVDAPEFHVLLQDNKFEPATLKVPANAKFKVLVTNRNTMPAEFESSDFNREKIVLPNSTITVFIGPLQPGTYKFFDDFHRATTGTLIAE